MDSLRNRLATVRARIAAAAERAHRNPSEVTLVAVSKKMPPELILEAFRLGQQDFGENRVQEFRDKQSALEGASMPGVQWHMVGHLQSNKARLAVRGFDIIQSVDSVKLASLLDGEAEAAGKQLPVLLQVDFTDEPQRAGFAPEELEAVAGEVVALGHLEVKGLMTVAPLGLSEPGLRAIFAEMRRLRVRLAARHPGVEWRDLSMGMSGDFELAIEEGATIVRIGQAIFGERPGV